MEQESNTRSKNSVIPTIQTIFIFKTSRFFSYFGVWESLKPVKTSIKKNLNKSCSPIWLKTYFLEEEKTCVSRVKDANI